MQPMQPGGAAPHPLAITPDRLRSRCDPATLGFATTADLAAPQRMTGQNRAAEALEFGLEVPDSRYNIFVAGPPGSGRSASTEAAVHEVARQRPVPNDWIYVHNFEKPYEPQAIAFPAGRARPFAKDVDALIEAVRQGLRDIFETEAYRKRRAEAVKSLEDRRDQLSKEFETLASSKGFAVQTGEDGPTFLPLKAAEEEGGEPSVYPSEEFTALPDDVKERFRENFEAVNEALAIANATNRRIVGQERTVVRELDRVVAREAIAPLFTAISEQYRDIAGVEVYFAQIIEDVITNINRLRADGEGGESTGGDGQSDGADPASQMAAMGPSPLTRYRVNVLVDHTGALHAPTIHEHNPTYSNLAGRLEYGTRMGNLFTDFSFIKPGSLHRANGGFLTIHARELLTSPKAWEVLKRSLRTGTIAIENPADVQQSMALAASLKPMAIPLQAKVIMLGDFDTWIALNEIDPDFSEIFKVRADFESQMARSSQNEHYYAAFVGEVARALKLPPLSRNAVALIIEEGSRMVEDQYKLSTSLSNIRDLVIEAGYYARKIDSAAIDAADVDRATKMRRRRLSIGVDRIDESIRQGTLMISITGSAVGQVNALGVIVSPRAAFGRPMRITARTYPGVAGVMDIEREIAMSGPIHSKGVLTLGGYLAGRYGQEHPLSLSGTISFEQVYDGVDGDSASLAELCALLSALAEVPIRQHFAITGSVNQWGEVQAVGGVTHKVEGFFDTCVLKGFGEYQAVIIPAANARNLMLRLDVIEAVHRGVFDVFAVQHVDEAIELLTGRLAGRANPQGEYLSNTVNALVLERLRKYAERVRRFRLSDREG